MMALTINSKYCDYSYRLNDGQELPVKIGQANVAGGVSYTNFIMPDNRVIHQVVDIENSIPDVYTHTKQKEHFAFKDMPDGSLIARYKYGTGKIAKEIQVKDGAVNGAVIEYGSDGEPYSIVQMKNDKKHGRSVSKDIFDDMQKVAYFWEGKSTDSFTWATKQNYEDITQGKFKPVIERILGTSPIKKLKLEK